MRAFPERSVADAWIRGSINGTACAGGGFTGDPVFVAVLDATERFAIPFGLLDELVAGTTMDLQQSTGDAPDTYATFTDLYQYCYLVASVVGLVCIQIFGYKDPAAEKLAEETGIAFQLTNILRDVAEDAEAAASICRWRILPRMTFRWMLCCIATQGRRRQQMSAHCLKRSRDAQKYYLSAEALMPLIDRESRPALWVLVSIYTLFSCASGGRIRCFLAAGRCAVAHKVAILAVGLARMAKARLFS